MCETLVIRYTSTQSFSSCHTTQLCAINVFDSTCYQCRFIHWALGAGAHGAQGPDKLDLTRFSGHKSRFSSAKGACRSSVSRARKELKFALRIAVPI
ncbi:hypothetical protein TNCV_1651991 [Trichonephila clavipes]|nr:hypothetical protein TNCV_1651991 [Trichonephila clavipes]